MGLPEGLTAQEMAALDEYLHRLRQEYGDQVVRVVLFGSRARGDAGPRSDTDLLVVVKTDARWTHRPIEQLGTEIALRYGLTLSELIIGPKRYQKLQRYRPPFYKRIEAEGIDLWTRAPAS